MASEPQHGGGAAFDHRHPPAADLIADCVHCGFCLPTCPTYLLWGEEMDSPRGRIHLMNIGLAGEPLDDAMVRHFDQCLGCMACVTACPSGVQYDRLIEATKAQVERRHSRSRRKRLLRALVFTVSPPPKRLRMRGPLRRPSSSGGQNRPPRGAPLPPPTAAMEQLLPPITRTAPVAEVTPAVGTQRARVGLLLG